MYATDPGSICSISCGPPEVIPECKAKSNCGAPPGVKASKTYQGSQFYIGESWTQTKLRPSLIQHLLGIYKILYFAHIVSFQTSNSKILMMSQLLFLPLISVELNSMILLEFKVHLPTTVSPKVLFDGMLK